MTKVLVFNKVLVLEYENTQCCEILQIIQTKPLPPSSERIKKTVPGEGFRPPILHGVTSHKSVILVFIAMRTLISSNYTHLRRKRNFVCQSF